MNGTRTGEKRLRLIHFVSSLCAQADVFLLNNSYALHTLTKLYICVVVENNYRRNVLFAASQKNIRIEIF